tara:strand:- start:1089 stop:1364 length:276 start_codon:yes stop_codon:yes gene_type:complete
MSSLQKSNNIYISHRDRLSVNSLSPSPSTKEYLHDCYGVSWDKDNKRESINIPRMTPPSINTAKIINSFIGAKVFKQSFSETDCSNTLSKK